jgi:hypothetical protein
MNRFDVYLLTVVVCGFILLGILLFTGHAGFAIKITNYLFVLLCFGQVYRYFNNE